MDEISTSFCFICLLHLANEEGLELKTGAVPRAAPARARRSVSAEPSAEGAEHGDSSETEDAGVGLDLAGGATDMGAMFEKMAEMGAGRKADEEDDALGGEWEGAEGGEVEEDEDEMRVGRLEYLNIVKDPNAGRSA